jgi:hypothetical protein
MAEARRSISLAFVLFAFQLDIAAGSGKKNPLESGLSHAL